MGRQGRGGDQRKSDPSKELVPFNISPKRFNHFDFSDVDDGDWCVVRSSRCAFAHSTDPGIYQAPGQGVTHPYAHTCTYIIYMHTYVIHMHTCHTHLPPFRKISNPDQRVTHPHELSHAHI